MTDITPCPECGVVPGVHVYNDPPEGLRYNVQCLHPRCVGLSLTYSYDTPAAAMTGWNKRAIDERERFTVIHTPAASYKWWVAEKVPGNIHRDWHSCYESEEEARREAARLNASASPK